MTSPRRGRRFCIQLVCAVAVFALLSWSFRDLRLERLSELLGRLGPLSVLVGILPQIAAIACDTIGFRAALAQMGTRVGYMGLLWVRVSTDALALCLPGGALVAEPFKLPLLVRHAAVDSATSAAAIVARKYLLLTSQAAFILLAALLVAQSSALGPLSLAWELNLPLLLAAAGVAVLGSGLFIRVLLSRGTAAIRIRQLLARLPSVRLREKLSTSGAVFVRTDAKLQQFFASGAKAEAKTSFWFFLGWASESLETLLLLEFLGADLSFSAVIAMEVLLSLIRSLAFFVPAGIGVQDAGYALLLRAFGVPDATEVAAALTLVKRSKELFLIGLGFLLLASDSRPTQSLPVVVATSGGAISRWRQPSPFRLRRDRARLEQS